MKNPHLTKNHGSTAFKPLLFSWGPRIRTTDILRLPLTMLLSFCFWDAFAQTAPFRTHSSENLGFSIDYPQDFVRVRESERGRVVFFARASGKKYPLVFVSKRRGSYTANSEKRHLEHILSEYRELGFVDAKIVSTYSNKFLYMNKMRHGVRVSYAIRGQKIMADVVYVSAGSSHFVITYADLPVDYPSHTNIRERLLSSFEVHNSLLRPAPRRNGAPKQLAKPSDETTLPIPVGNPQRQQRPPILGALLLVAAIILGAATIFRQDTTNGSNAEEKKGGGKKAAND